MVLEAMTGQKKIDEIEMGKYEKAIEKWEIDREFVSRYRTGAYSQYGISGISRKY